MASYYESKRQRKFLAGYTCSKCRSVVVAEGCLTVIGRAHNQKKAQEALEVADDRGYRAIRNCREKPFRVSRIMEFENEVGRNTLCGYYVENLGHGCPYCGNQELWQLDANRPLPYGKQLADFQTGLELLKGIPEGSTPTVLESADQVKEYKTLTLVQLNKANQEHWGANPGEARQLKARVEAMDAELQSLKEQKSALGAEAKAMEQQLEELTEKSKSYGLFSKERSAANAEIKALKKALDARKSADFNTERGILDKIVAMEKQRKELLIANPGVTGMLSTLTANGPLFREATRLD